MHVQITDDLEYIEISALEPGKFFTLGLTCPLTFVSRGAYVTARGTTEIEASCMAGMRDGKAYSKTFYKPKLEVLIVPDEHVGARVGSAIEAFRDRNFRGCERVELATGIWPWTGDADSLAEVEDLAGMEVCS
ncbi:hypothetical protein [Brevibacterium limosum]|uniref:hypothetical protein n=1 Tax=Brevibacterium limosum TaxID=2697565 RepID=UPI001420CDDE|nr:hypothetical protein [Brevibacterium limosum]